MTRRLLLHRDEPKWYEFEFDAQNKTLRMRVAPGVADFITALLIKYPHLTRSFEEGVKLPDFTMPGPECWGFDRNIRQSMDADGWTAFAIGLPVMNLGSRNKKAKSQGWADAYAASASLQVLFDALNHYDEPTACPTKQIATIEGMCLRQVAFYGAVLYAALSPTACAWLAKQPAGGAEYPEMGQRMAEAYRHMYGTGADQVLDHEFCITVWPPKRLLIRCAGNACELFTDGSAMDIDPGLHLVPHNTDSPIEQITLLVGLAILCQTIREETYANPDV